MDPRSGRQVLFDYFGYIYNLKAVQSESNQFLPLFAQCPLRDCSKLALGHIDLNLAIGKYLMCDDRFHNSDSYTIVRAIVIRIWLKFLATKFHSLCSTSNLEIYIICRLFQTYMCDMSVYDDKKLLSPVVA